VSKYAPRRETRGGAICAGTGAMTALKVQERQKRIGLVLGSGSARGWAHIGVIRALLDGGIEPDIVCGTSIGALVGAAYLMKKLDGLEAWVLGINTRNIVRYLDIRLVVGGGFVEGKRLMDFLRHRFGDVLIEDLPKPFATVATDLKTGSEIWLRNGPVWDAVRASIALPGIITPAYRDGQWLVDGGLVNPVPVSLCRALGAERVIAVNLNGGIVGKHFVERLKRPPQRDKTSTEARFLDKLTIQFKTRMAGVGPGLFDVLAGSINIMQDRITGSRITGDSPDVMIVPQLAHIGLLEFDRAREAMDEGQACVRRTMTDLLRSVGGPETYFSPPH
jgi:NTE family protein